MLWCFRRANVSMHAHPTNRLALLTGQLSKRAIQSHPDDEMKTFARWVGRIPQLVGDNTMTYSDVWQSRAYYGSRREEDIVW